MCFQNYIIYMCDHSKASFIEYCTTHTRKCGLPGYPPSFCIYAKQKCDECRKEEARAWRAELREMSKERVVKHKEMKRLKLEMKRIEDSEFVMGGDKDGGLNALGLFFGD